MADPTAEWLTRAARTCLTLARQHSELGAFVGAGGSGGGDGSGIRVARIDAPLPIRVEVVDLRADIERGMERYAALTQGTLRICCRWSSTAGRLGMVGDRLRDLHTVDPDLAGEVIESVWDWHRDASRVLPPPPSGRTRPFRIPEACPGCGFRSLWLDPATWRIGCGMPSCRRLWGVHERILEE